MLITKTHHHDIVGQLQQRLADKQAELERLLAQVGDLRQERDQFRDLFVQAMGAQWQKPIQEMPLQTRTLKLSAQEEFATMTSRWSPAEKSAYECWLRDEGDVEEPERAWMERFGGASPMEVLQ